MSLTGRTHRTCLYGASRNTPTQKGVLETLATEKMKSSLTQNDGDEYLGKFHLHPTIGSDRPSETDKKGMEFRKLDFIVYVNGKKLLTRKLNEASDIEIISPAGSYEVALVRCKSKLKSDGGGQDNYLIDLESGVGTAMRLKVNPFTLLLKLGLSDCMDFSLIIVIGMDTRICK